MRVKILAPMVITAIALYTGYATGLSRTAPELKSLEARVDEVSKISSQQLDNMIDIINEKDYIINNIVVPTGTVDAQFGAGFKAGKFEVTAYSPYENFNGIQADDTPDQTATMTRPHIGTFAVDPKVIPLRSTVVIIYPDGTVERGRAEDTGGAVKGNHIDVFRPAFKTAQKFGVKQAVVIWYKED